MGTITEEMKQMVETQRIGYVATSSKDGMPNVSPKGTTKVVDDNTLAFACIMSEKTIKNLEENPQIALALADVAKVKGYQFKGTAKLETSGSLYDEMAAEAAQRKLPKPKCIARITVTEVHQLPPRA